MISVSVRLLFILCFSLIWCFNSFSTEKAHSEADELEWKRIGPYKVAISAGYNNGNGKILIKKGRKIVYKELEENHYYFYGNQFDEKIRSKDIYSGTDITGKKIPNLVITKWTGGAHCCHSLYVFELGKKIKKLTVVEAGSSSIRLVDLDQDGIPEIEFWDGAIDYRFASFAWSPPGRTILKFNNGEYEVARLLMKKPAPNPQKLTRLKAKVRKEFKENGPQHPDLPYTLLETMMNLSYSGHLDLALKFADDAWPKEKLDLLNFKKDFQESLRASPYWSEFANLPKIDADIAHTRRAEMGMGRFLSFYKKLKSR